MDNIVDLRSFNQKEVLKFRLGYTSNEVIHIHGSLHNNTTPVLGVDRIDQLNVTYNLSAKGKRTLLKPTFNSEVDSYRIESAKNLIDHAKYICTFGLSLGLSDLTWREYIISWLESSKWHQLFVYDYSAYFKDDLEDDERLDLEDDLKKSFFLDWGLDSSLLQQIHMPCGNKIFNYKEVIDSFINTEKS